MRKRLIFLWRLLLDWLLVCAGSLGSMFCLITAFSLPYPFEIWLLTPLLALIFCLLLGTKSAKYHALAQLVFGLLLVWLLQEPLLESFRNLWGVLCGHYIMGYDSFQNLMPREPCAAEAAWRALLALSILETWVSSLCVRLWRRTFPAALALLPGIVPCFILTDTLPALLPLLAAVFSLLTQALSQSVRRRAAGDEGKAITLAALLAAGLLGLLLLLFPQKDFAPPITWDQLSEKMRQWGEKQNNRGNELAGLSGSPESVDLAALGALPNHPTTALYVRSSVDDYLYLRSSAYNQFDGAYWSKGAVAGYGDTALLPYLGYYPSGYTLEIDTVQAETELYTTYQTISLPEGARVDTDCYVRNPDGRLHYSLSFTQRDPILSLDRGYDNWVLAHCLELPDRTREGVLAWWEAQDGGTPPSGSVEGTEAFARHVAELVAATAVYSRNPQRVPEGVDFCTWFLNEAEEGYCVHYATACTALLRALGLPARYASGYVCSAEADKRVQVTNLQAHAWVELWSGGRWVVVEPTPDDATEFTGVAVFGGDRPAGPVEPSETTAPETYPAPPSETLEPLPWESTEPRHTKSTHDPSADNPQPGSYSDPQPKDLTPLWVVLGVIGFLALVLGRRALALRLWENRVSHAKGNARAKLLYRRMLRMEKLGAGPIPEEARRLAYRAGFSQHTLSVEELRYLRQAHSQLSSRLSVAGFWRRLYCKYVLAII